MASPLYKCPHLARSRLHGFFLWSIVWAPNVHLTEETAGKQGQPDDEDQRQGRDQEVLQVRIAH
jgi:hypothetical protein